MRRTASCSAARPVLARAGRVPGRRGGHDPVEARRPRRRPRRSAPPRAGSARAGARARRASEPCGTVNQLQCAHTSTRSSAAPLGPVGPAARERALQARARQLAEPEHPVGDDRVVDVHPRRLRPPRRRAASCRPRGRPTSAARTPPRRGFGGSVARPRREADAAHAKAPRAWHQRRGDRHRHPAP